MLNVIPTVNEIVTKEQPCQPSGKDILMRVWIYGRNEQDICSMLAYCAGNADTIIGFSIQKDVLSPFPQDGLTQPMQAAIRGELDQLLISDFTLLGDKEEQICEIKGAFQSYQVSIKSACSSGSSSS